VLYVMSSNAVYGVARERVHSPLSQLAMFVDAADRIAVGDVFSSLRSVVPAPSLSCSMQRTCCPSLTISIPSSPSCSTPRRCSHSRKSVMLVEAACWRVCIHTELYVIT